MNAKSRFEQLQAKWRAARDNGWTNYETWNVALWLDDEQGSKEYWAEAAQEAYDAAEADQAFTKEENASFSLRERLKLELDEQSEESGYLPKLQGFYADLMNAALFKVDWQEIAEHYITGVNKEAYDHIHRVRNHCVRL